MNVCLIMLNTSRCTVLSILKLHEYHYILLIVGRIMLGYKLTKLS